MDKDRESVKNRWRNYNLQQKVRYIWDYYHLYLILIPALILIVIFLIVSPGRKSEQGEFFVLIVGTSLNEDQNSEMEKVLTQVTGLNKDKIVIDTYAMETEREAASASAYMRSGRVDLLIGPDKVFNRYAVSGYLQELKSEDIEAESIVHQRSFYARQIEFDTVGAFSENDFVFAPADKSKGAKCFGIYPEKINQSIGIPDQSVWGYMKNAPHKGSCQKALKEIGDR